MNRRSFLKKGLASGAWAFGTQPLFSLDGKELSFSDIPLVDTHLHLWDLNEMDYPWLQGRGLPLERNYSLQDYQKATEKHPVSKMIFVECGRSPEQYLREVDWVQGQAGGDSGMAGMVAYFPLERGLAGQAAMEEMAEREIVRGIRKNFMPGHSGYLQGIGLMGKFRWVCELNVGPGQLAEVIDMVRKFPGQEFVLDHLANPDIANQDWKTWADELAPFASIQQVHCKISGMITKAARAWEVAHLEPYFDTVLNVFGPDRVLYGGDWPVVLRAGSLLDWTTAFFSLSKTLSTPEKKKLYHENAEKLYRI
ncbi:amidohydrolase family protein [Cyclobacterium xiamenense]|uniref:amidohydrolase family protein n=1 Tax=Cyclobacterium xiamenense TaxID=1297121 RepID=UPI0035D12750